MKKILSLIIVCLAFNGLSQVSFSKKAFVVDLNANFGIYNTKAQDSTQRAKGHVNEDKAVPYGFALGLEYGVLNWLGIGLKGQAITYLTSKDSVSGLTPSVKSKDIALVVNAHLLRKKRFDLVFGGDLGYSGIKFETHDNKLTVAKGGGLMYDLHLTPRLYFGNHFGMFFNLAYAGYGYNKLKVSDNVRTYTDHINLKASGVSYAIGFQVKFGGE